MAETPNQELSELVRLVALMRRSQKQYFRTRDRTALQESKERERQVDVWLEEREARKGPTLF